MAKFGEGGLALMLAKNIPVSSIRVYPFLNLSLPMARNHQKSAISPFFGEVLPLPYAATLMTYPGPHAT
jgi:hypothetical protein